MTVEHFDISGYVTGIDYAKEPDDSAFFVAGLRAGTMEIVGTWDPVQSLPLMYSVHMAGFARLARKTKKAVKKWCLGSTLTRHEQRRLARLPK